MTELEKQNAARKAALEAKISANADEISTMAKSELKQLLADTKYATPEEAEKVLEKAENMLHKILGEPVQHPAKEESKPVQLRKEAPRMLSAEERAAAAKRLEKIFDEAEKESAQLRANLAKIPVEEQKKQAKAAYKAGVYSRDEYAAEMQRIGKLEAAATPAPEPKPEPKLPTGAYIAYQGATVGGEYVIVKDDRGNQASGESKAEAIRNLIAMREKNKGEKKQMTGSPKQVAWAEKIIAYKTKGAKTSGIDEKKWENAVKHITEKYGARGWIDMRDEHPRQIVAQFGADLHDLRQKKYEESVHDALEKTRRDDIRKQAVKQGLNPEIVLKTDEILHKAKDPQLQSIVRPLLRDAAEAAKRGDDKTAMDLLRRAEENFREAPAEISSAGAAKPEPNWANMSADEIAGEYADGMAKIISKHAEFAIEMMDGDKYAINAAAEKAADILQKRATKWTQTVTENVAEMLAEGAKSSESPLKVAEELESACVAHAETVARTEMARAREMANLDIMKAQNVEKVQFIASEDERMCPICGQYHGKVYDVGSAPVLPLHPNCRCTLVPYIDPEEL